MNRSQQPGKRIVSKSAYATLKGLALSLRVFSGGFIMLTLCCWCIAALMFSCLACVIVTFFMMLCCRKDVWPLSPWFINSLLAGGIFAVATKGFAFFYHVSTGTARRIKDVVPATRANTADLPANDSLVRASQEPIQAQEDILLRAVTQAQESHEEQLLRATTTE